MSHLAENDSFRSQKNIVIRTFRSADRNAFYALNESWITENFSMDDRDKYILGDPISSVIKPGGEIFLICRDEEVLGCCALILLDTQCLEVAKMAVKKDCRGKGLGRQLLSRVIEHAKSRGACRLCLKTSSMLQAAIHLYTSMGFHIIEPEMSNLCRNARADVFMELAL